MKWFLTLALDHSLFGQAKNISVSLVWIYVCIYGIHHASKRDNHKTDIKRRHGVFQD